MDLAPVDRPPAVSTLLTDRVADRPNLNDAETMRLIEIARAEFMTHGFRRTAVGDIADRAGVTRRTVNRRLGEKEDIVSVVIALEVQDFFARVAVAAIRPTAEETVVEAFVAGMREAQNHPLSQAIRQFEHDSPALLIPTERVVTAVAQLISYDRSIGHERAAQLADLLLRVASTLLLHPSSVLVTGDDDQVRALAQTWFVPLVQAARSSE